MNMLTEVCHLIVPYNVLPVSLEKRLLSAETSRCYCLQNQACIADWIVFVGNRCADIVRLRGHCCAAIASVIVETSSFVCL